MECSKEIVYHLRIARNIAVVLLFNALIIVQPGYSHRPRIPENNFSAEDAFAIGDAQISWAIYAELEEENTAAYFTFEVTQTSTLTPEILVEDEPRLSGFEPLFLIYGVDGSNAEPPEPVALPAGAEYVLSNAVSEDYFEGFTRKSFLRTASLEITLDPGTYGVAVFDPKQGTGPFVFAIGTAEVFDGSDFPPMIVGCGKIFY